MRCGRSVNALLMTAGHQHTVILLLLMLAMMLSAV